MAQYTVYKQNIIQTDLTKVNRSIVWKYQKNINMKKLSSKKLESDIVKARITYVYAIKK